jgi:hypothetical protein
MSAVFSIASHSILQYLPEVAKHEQIGCAHFSPFPSDISLSCASTNSSVQPRMTQALSYSHESAASVPKGTHCNSAPRQQKQPSFCTLKIRAKIPIIIATPEWRNWQTRRTQNPVAARPCGFDPLLRHQSAPTAPLFTLSDAKGRLRCGNTSTNPPRSTIRGCTAGVPAGSDDYKSLSMHHSRPVCGARALVLEAARHLVC